MRTFDLFGDFPSVHVFAPLVSRKHDVLVQLLGKHSDLLERDGVDVGERLLTYLPTRCGFMSVIAHTYQNKFVQRKCTVPLSALDKH